MKLGYTIVWSGWQGRRRRGRRRIRRTFPPIAMNTTVPVVNEPRRVHASIAPPRRLRWRSVTGRDARPIAGQVHRCANSSGIPHAGEQLELRRRQHHPLHTRPASTIAPSYEFIYPRATGAKVMGLGSPLSRLRLLLPPPRGGRLLDA